MLEDLEVGIDVGILWLAPVSIHSIVRLQAWTEYLALCLCTYMTYVGMKQFTR